MLQRLLNNQLADLAGTRIEGQIVLSDALMNEAIQLGLKEIATPVNTEKAAVSTVDFPVINPRDLLAALTIEKLNYRTENGKTTLEIKAGI